MKKIVFSLFLFLSTVALYSQGIGINASGTPAAANAMLDVSSTNKGVFIPRVTTAQRKAIAVTSNDMGLLVFDKERDLLYMYDGSKWIPFATAVNEAISYSTTITDPPVSKKAHFGFAVAVDSIYAVVGSPDDSVGTKKNQGTAQVFKKQNGSWIQVAELTSSDGVANDRFGTCVAISGDYIVAGTPYYNYNANASIISSGAAYIFHRVGNNWVQIQKLRSDNPYQMESFANSIAMTDSLIVIGTPGNTLLGTIGSVYVYSLTGNTWGRDTILTATGASPGDQMGSSVSISKTGNYIVAGAPEANNTALGLTDCGAVYVFANSHGHWFQHAILYDDFPTAYAHFGGKSSIYGNEIIVSDNSNGCKLFRKSGSNWIYTTYFVNPTVNSGNFGADMVMDANYMLIGAPDDEVQGMPSAGAVYVYKRNASGDFDFYKRIADKDPYSHDEFGTSVAFDGYNLLIGSPGLISPTSKGKVLFGIVSD
jgi:hypothetical protein